MASWISSGVRAQSTVSCFCPMESPLRFKWSCFWWLVASLISATGDRTFLSGCLLSHGLSASAGWEFTVRINGRLASDSTLSAWSPIRRRWPSGLPPSQGWHAIRMKWRKRPMLTRLARSHARSMIMPTPWCAAVWRTLPSTFNRWPKYLSWLLSLASCLDWTWMPARPTITGASVSWSPSFPESGYSFPCHGSSWKSDVQVKILANKAFSLQVYGSFGMLWNRSGTWSRVWSISLVRPSGTGQLGRKSGTIADSSLMT